MKGLLNSRIAEALRREPAHEYQPSMLHITIPGFGEIVNPWIQHERKNCIRDARAVMTDWTAERRRKPSATKFKAALFMCLATRSR